MLLLRSFVLTQSGDHPLEDVEKVTVILGRFSQIWLQIMYEIQNFNHPSIFLATH
jgi:hypothetical protein